MCLSASEFTEFIPLVRLFQSLRPHTGIFYCHSGKLPISEICFQIQRKIICFSPDFLRILQKGCQIKISNKAEDVAYAVGYIYIDEPLEYKI